jgi:hypothetical protein
MKTIIVEDDRVGKFTWELPEDFADLLSKATNIQTNPTPGGQEALDEAHQIFLEDIQTMIKQTLVLITFGSIVFSGFYVNKPEEVGKLFNSIQNSNRRRIKKLTDAL